MSAFSPGREHATTAVFAGLPPPLKLRRAKHGKAAAKPWRSRDRATSIPETGVGLPRSRGVLRPPRSRRTTLEAGQHRALRLLLHVLDAGKIDALGAFAGVAEVKFVLGEEHRVAVDIVSDARAVGGNEGI